MKEVKQTIAITLSKEAIAKLEEINNQFSGGLNRSKFINNLIINYKVN